MSTPELEAVRTGATVRALREAYGWRTVKFAAAVGISPAYLSNIEAGRRHLPVDLARKVADVLGVPLAAITTGVEPEAVA
jgi:transcriptional regulator with XRE-family HTH domain